MIATWHLPCAPRYRPPLWRYNDDHSPITLGRNAAMAEKAFTASPPPPSLRRHATTPRPTTCSHRRRAAQHLPSNSPPPIDFITQHHHHRQPPHPLAQNTHPRAHVQVWDADQRTPSSPIHHVRTLVAQRHAVNSHHHHHTPPAPTHYQPTYPLHSPPPPSPTATTKNDA